MLSDLIPDHPANFTAAPIKAIKLVDLPIYIRPFLIAQQKRLPVEVLIDL